MISPIYAGILALLIVRLSLNVINLRRAKKIAVGDGGDTDLQYAIRAQGNATEYIPIALILLILLELGGVNGWLVHAGGITLVLGRGLHAYGLTKQTLRYRILGMQVTIYTIVALAAIDISVGIYRLFTGA